MTDDAGPRRPPPARKTNVAVVGARDEKSGALALVEPLRFGAPGLTIAYGHGNSPPSLAMG